MPVSSGQGFTLADVIDYEMQLAHDSRREPDELLARDKALKLDSGTLKLGKKASLQAWLKLVRGSVGARFLQLRQLLQIGLVILGALMGWATVHGLLTYDGYHPVNILPLLALFAALPLVLLGLLFFKGLVARLVGRLPGGWVTGSGQWLLARVMKKNQMEVASLDVWHRLRSLYPQIFAWQAWMLSQTFALAYYITALSCFLFHVSVADYAFAWQTTLRLGPELLERIVHGIAWPFAFLGPAFVPDSDLIVATQYDRFAGAYVQGHGPSLAADWWPFVAAVIAVYGLFPRLILWLYFKVRLHLRLVRLRFDDFASEAVWLRLQRSGLGWEAAAGTRELPLGSAEEPINLHTGTPLVVVRWRQAPFTDSALREYFSSGGHAVESIFDAEGRDSEFPPVLHALTKGRRLALVCDPWELPGEAFNRLRLAVREHLPVRTPILLVPLHQKKEGAAALAHDELSLWGASLKAFRDPYIGLLQDGGMPS